MNTVGAKSDREISRFLEIESQILISDIELKFRPKSVSTISIFQKI